MDLTHTFQDGGEGETLQTKVPFSLSCTLRKPHLKLSSSLILNLEDTGGNWLLKPKLWDVSSVPLSQCLAATNDSSLFFSLSLLLLPSFLSLSLSPFLLSLKKFLLARTYFYVYAMDIWIYTETQCKETLSNITGDSP